ncbi:MAG: tetratricopeptide repeat protein, partial [Fibromonadales bacterium]|nr:tetratricopeptide repeat protein [Fibromonadales bacterium]
AEQLAEKVENLPDLTGDMDSLLAKGLPPEEDNDILAQNPTSTLAELYISQGLPQKAVAVYKELLSRNPGDIELQAKLAIAQAKTSV